LPAAAAAAAAAAGLAALHSALAFSAIAPRSVCVCV
jgi:hypothetical protein